MKRYSVIVNVNLEYIVSAKDEEEAKVYVENVELPKEYLVDSFELVKVLEEKPYCTFNACKNIQYTDDSGFQHDICKKHFLQGINN